MSKAKYTAAEAEVIARGWATSGMPQAPYAMRYGVAERTLRCWLTRYVPAPKLESVREIIVDAMERLEKLLDVVDQRAVEQPACRPAPPIFRIRSTDTQLELLPVCQAACREEKLGVAALVSSSDTASVTQPSPTTGKRRKGDFCFDA